MYHGKDYVEKFIEYTEGKVNCLYAIFPLQLMAEIADVLKRKLEAAEKSHIWFKEVRYEKRKARNHCHYTRLYRGAAHNNCNLKYWTPIHGVSQRKGYKAHLSIKELGQKFSRDAIGVIAKNKEKYISFNVKINAKMTGLTNKDSE